MQFNKLHQGAAQEAALQGYQALGYAGHGALDGLGLGAAVSTVMATRDTVKARRKQRLFEKSGGLMGSSRTKANKEITKTWSGAVVGTASGTAGGMAAGAVIGQVQSIH